MATTPSRTAILCSIKAVYEDYRPRLSVDLGALRRNAQSLQARRPGATLIPVVKADAYGLGASKVVGTLREEGCNAFYVSYLSEAESLAEPSGHAVFYVLNAGPGSGPYTEQHRPVFFRVKDLLAFSGGPCGLQVNIGMNRLGEAQDRLTELSPRPKVKLFVAHMSDAGDPSSHRNADQRAMYQRLKDRLRTTFPHAAFSISASGGLLLDGQVDEDAIRPGMALFGGQAGALGPLETVAKFGARVLSVFDVAKGEPVGYGGRWVAERPSRCATLSVGYADGYPRSLTNVGTVMIGSASCPVAGAVSMDLMTVDVTDAEEVKPGDWAELYGTTPTLDDVATKAGLIGYELLTMVRGRTVRVYEDSERKRSTSS